MEHSEPDTSWQSSFRTNSPDRLYISPVALKDEADAEFLEGVFTLLDQVEKEHRVKKQKVESEQLEVPSEKKLEYWGIPIEICERYKEKSIVELYDWQVECLKSPGVLEGRNLVYSGLNSYSFFDSLAAPTSGGKTLGFSIEYPFDQLSGRNFDAEATDGSQKEGPFRPTLCECC